MRSLALVLIAAIGFPVAANAQSLGHSPSHDMAERWHRGRVLYGVGSVTGLLGSALTLSSVITSAVTGYPCDPNDAFHQLNPNDSCNPNNPNFRQSKPTDAAPLLGYIGSTASAFGFVLSAAGLGYQHFLLRELEADPGRALFAAGTTFGIMGFATVGASYFFGLTNYLDPHDQGLAIMATTITGTVLCVLGGLLYTIDEGRVQRIWRRISTF